MRPHVMGCLTVSLLAGACMACTATDGTVDADAAAVGEFAESLGPCETGVREGPSIYEYLAAPGAWLRVDDAEALPGEGELDDSKLRADLEYLGGDPEMADPGRAAAEGDQLLFASEPMARLVAKATAEAAETYVKIGVDEGASNPEIRYSIAFDERGEFAFVGNCKAVRYVEPITERFGADAPHIVRRLVGADAVTSRELLQLEPLDEAEPDDQPLVLNHEDTDPSVLEGLRTGRLRLSDVPESWLGEYGVCTRVEQGWSPCLFLRDRSLAELTAPVWYDPENPVVEIWLVDGVLNLAEPIAKLGEVDVAEAIRTVDDLRSVEIELSVPPSTSVHEVAERGEPPAGVTVRAEAAPLDAPS